MACLRRPVWEQSSWLCWHIFCPCWPTLTAGMLLIQTIVVDARAHMLGRLASILAKQLLGGQQVVRPTSGMLSRSQLESSLKASLPIEAPLQHHTCLADTQGGQQRFLPGLAALVPKPR